MRTLIRWAITNTPAMNTLMLAILIVGGVGFSFMRRELFPEFELEMILINVPYPGASPEEVEEGICQKVEEAVQAVDGIKNIYGVAREGIGSVILELEADVPDVQKVLNEVRSEIDRIASFPELAEDPEVKQITMRREAIQIAVLGPEDGETAERALRDLAERIRREVLMLPSVKQAELVGAKPYQIDIEISEHTLRKYGLSLQDVARIVRQENLELPGGVLRTRIQEFLLRGKNKREIGWEIAQLPLVRDPSGVVLTVGDVGRVRDGFEDVAALHRIDGRPAMVIKVEKTAAEDLLAITEEVQDFVQRANADPSLVPAGYELRSFGDMSGIVRARLRLLSKNGLQGLVLVFLALAVFLEIRLAFWVALGIPIAVFGAGAYMWFTGETLNMLSMFGFLMALGIVVDDAIVIGENTYAHREMGKGLVQAAVDGAVEVLPSVLASVTTTIIAFAPLLFVPGVMGKFIAVMPVVVIAMLTVSLIEAMFILPCHLAHSGEHERAGQWRRSGPVPHAWAFARRFPPAIRWTFGLLCVALAGAAWFFLYPFVQLSRRANLLSARLLQFVIDRVYTPAVRWTLDRPGFVFCSAIALLLVAGGAVAGGIVPFVTFPKLDGDYIMANVEYPDGTAEAVTREATRMLEEAVWRVNSQHAAPGRPLVLLSHRIVGARAAMGNPREVASGVTGSHVGGVYVELAGAEHRSITSMEILNAWRRAALEGWVDPETGVRRTLPAGYDSLNFTAAGIGPGGAAIEFRLLAPAEHMAELEEAVEECKKRLDEYPGVYDIADDSRAGKWEFQIRPNRTAQALGVTLADLAGAVRAAYYGEEIMRLQRGRHEIKLMARYPRQQRRTLASLNDVRVRTADGAERPLAELAEITVQRGYSTINRLEQMRSVTITADVEESEASSSKIIAELKNTFLPALVKKHPAVYVRWGGLQQEREESIQGLQKGLAIALVCMFALLTLEFRTYLQPLLIMTAIPFGFIGAVVGHAVVGIPVSLLSLFGMVALTGVVVNDSIVLIDFMNRRIQAGAPIREAIIESGRRRFRPVLLTSLTTIAALLPILVERSFQAQVVIPMATSLTFGLMFTTLIVLVLVPATYLLYCRYIAPPAAAGEREQVEAPPARPAAPEPTAVLSPDGR